MPYGFGRFIATKDSNMYEVSFSFIGYFFKKIIASRFDVWAFETDQGTGVLFTSGVKNWEGFYQQR
jgi:hypothetical protein